MALRVIRAFWEGIRDQWRRVPPERRARGLVAGAVTFVYIVVGAGLSIAEPWGPNSVLYVLGVGGGTLMVLTLAGVTRQAVLDMRRARRKRLSPGSGRRSPTRPGANRRT